MDWEKQSSDALFRPEYQHGNAQPHLCDDPDAALPYFASGFREAAKAETDRICKVDFPDYACLPVVFLYRHATELYLKAVIKMGDRVLQVRGLPQTGLAKELSQHSLLPLVPGIEHVLQTLNWLWPGIDPASDTFKRMRAIIAEFESIDPNSFAFRYSTTKKGDQPLNPGFIFNVRIFSQTIEPILESLDTLALNLYDEWSRAASTSE
jgi:hypothetical protein